MEVVWIDCASRKQSKSVDKRLLRPQTSHNQGGWSWSSHFRRFANVVAHSRGGAVSERDSQCVGRGFSMNSDCLTYSKTIPGVFHGSGNWLKVVFRTGSWCVQRLKSTGPPSDSRHPPKKHGSATLGTIMKNYFRPAAAILESYWNQRVGCRTVPGEPKQRDLLTSGSPRLALPIYDDEEKQIKRR